MVASPRIGGILPGGVPTDEEFGALKAKLISGAIHVQGGSNSADTSCQSMQAETSGVYFTRVYGRMSRNLFLTGLVVYSGALLIVYFGDIPLAPVIKLAKR